MNLRPLLVSLLLAAPFGAHAATAWTVDPATSTLTFSGKADGEAFTGTFKSFDAKITFDPANVASSAFDVTVDLTSADSGNGDRDQTLQGAEFFNSKKKGTALFKATTFVAQEGGKYSANGNLDLNGALKPVTLEFTWTGNAKAATLVGEAKVDRMNFNVGTGDWEDAATIAHEVIVKTTLHLTAK